MLTAPPICDTDLCPADLSIFKRAAFKKHNCLEMCDDFLRILSGFEEFEEFEGYEGFEEFEDF